MRIFIDCEFIEDGKTIDLMSIGLVREDGVELYLESSECDHSRANAWVQEHVLPKLRADVHRFTRKEIAAAIVAFVEDSGPAPEFWADYAAYDWVALCQLFGTMIDLPKGWPMFCRDLQQLIATCTDPDIAALAKLEGENPHNALGDARDVKLIWEALTEAARADVIAAAAAAEQLQQQAKIAELSPKPAAKRKRTATKAN